MPLDAAGDDFSGLEVLSWRHPAKAAEVRRIRIKHEVIASSCAQNLVAGVRIERVEIEDKIQSGAFKGKHLGRFVNLEQLRLAGEKAICASD